MKTNRTNWIKLPDHETEPFTHTLRYFTLLGRSWFGQYIFWKWCTIETLFCIRLCCYLNSTVALCKFPCIWWEFEEFTQWPVGCVDDVWSLRALVVLRVHVSCTFWRISGLRWLDRNKWRALCLSKNSNNIVISYSIALKLSHFTRNLSRNNTYVNM